MASGRVHDISIALLFSPVLIGAFFYLPSVLHNGLAPVIFSASYLTGGIWLSPDIDLRQSLPSQRLSILSPLWKPYRLASGHRGFSHLPIVGTLSRIFYTIIPFIIWMIVIKYNPTSFIVQNEEALIALFMGLEISCLVHLIMDYMPGLNKLR